MAGFNHFAQLAQKLHGALRDIVVETAQEAQDNIQAQIQANGQVDTGFMLSSVYNVTSQGSTYGQAGTPPGDSYLLPEAPTPPDEYTAYAGCAANYGGYQNYGTRFLPPRPFWEPGLDVTRSHFEAKLDTIESRL